jgi:hypothetical protein
MCKFVPDLSMKKLLLAGLCLIQTIAFSQDLIVTNYSGPTGFDRYEELSVNVTVKNSGIVGISKPFYAGVYLSTDNTWQSTDLRITGTRAGYRIPFENTVGAGLSLTAKNPRARVDVAPGTYYLIIKVDPESSIAETNESNNLLVIPGVVINAPDVDFTFSSFALDKTSFEQNSMVKPLCEINNLGSTNAGDYVWSFYYVSNDATLSSDDKKLSGFAHDLTGSDNLSARADDFLVLPTLDPGQYYLIGWVDHDGYPEEDFVETNEGNNQVVRQFTVIPTKADLIVTGVTRLQNVYDLEYHGEIKVKNIGLSGAGGYPVGIELLDKNYSLVDRPYTTVFSGTMTHVDAGEEREIPVSFRLNYNPGPGLYYVRYTVNDDMFNTPIPETNISNNDYVDSTYPIVIAPPPITSVSLNDIGVSGLVDDTDLNVKVNLSFTNTGNTSNFSQLYSVEIRNSASTIWSQTESIYFSMGAGQSVSKGVTVNLPASLSVGQYKIFVGCVNSCNTTPTSKIKDFTVVPTMYNVTGVIKGEDGTPITKGKLFLYQDDGESEVRFIQKIDPYNASSFTFPIDANKHTLYFIPDPVTYTQYVPTIYGKTLTLGPSNFFSTTANMNVEFEILKVMPGPSGIGIINGSVVSDAEEGRMGGPLEVSSLSGIPVVLISPGGDVVGFTHTDETGFYEFKGLKQQEYKVILLFELDHVNRMEPFPVDITNKNMTVDFQLSATGSTPKASQYYLFQEITFNAFASYRYGDPPIELNAQADTGLPIQYQTSDNTIADIVADKVIIKGAGTVTITAVQPGDTYYSPATEERQLTIDKGLQSILFEPLADVNSDAGSIELIATASSGLPVVYESSDEQIVSIDGNIATIKQAGTVNITAKQSGNQNYLAAENVIQALVVNVVLGVSEFISSRDMYPNPTSDVVVVDVPKTASVEVLDIMGRQSQATRNGSTLDFSKCDSGIYIVKVRINDAVMFGRIVKR